MSFISVYGCNLNIKSIFWYFLEYFITKLGPAPFRGFGMSIKKGSSELGLDGIAYRIYGCGTYNYSPEIVVPLESTIVLPN